MYILGGTTETNSSESCAIHMGSGTPENSEHRSNNSYNTPIYSVLDISQNKKYIAYIKTATTEGGADDFGESNTYTLYHHKFVEKAEKFKVELDIGNGSWPGQRCYFLSISNDGEHIAISYVTTNSDTDHREYADSATVLVYKKGRKEPQQIAFSGRAVFLKDGKLALINTHDLQIYKLRKGGLQMIRRSNEEEFKMSHWFNLKPVVCGEDYINASALRSEKDDTIAALQWIDFSKASSFTKLERGYLNRDIVCLSKHLRDNVLVAVYKDNISRVWSIAENGIRLTAFHSPFHEDIMAFSSDYKFFATLVKENNNINVYNVKTGLIVATLKALSNSGDKTDQASPSNRVNYMRFCGNGRYLATISLTEKYDEDKSNTEIAFGVWSVAATKLIYNETEHIIIDWDMKKKVVMPFIEERPDDTLLLTEQGHETTTVRSEENIPRTDRLPKLVATYSTLVSGKEIGIGTKVIDIFSSTEQKEDDKWIITVPEKKEGKDNKKPEIDNDLSDYNNLSCLRISKLGIEYLLRIGAKTIQLWRIHAQEANTEDSGKLIYIRAFKAPTHGFGNTYEKEYERKEQKISPKDILEINEKEKQGRMTIRIESDKGSYTDEVFFPLDTELSRDRICDYHYIESAIQALHYLYKQCLENPNYEQTSNAQKIIKETKNIIERSIRAMKRQIMPSRYFTTLSGSNTLAMLASFAVGRDILFDIIKTDELPVALFSFVPKVGKSLNALTVLLDEFDHKLYKLLFNRVIENSKKLGAGCFTAVMDALIHLQERGNNALLVESTQKLSYVQIDHRILTILDEEAEKNKSIYLSVLLKDFEPEFKDLRSLWTREQITKYEPKSWRASCHKVSSLWSSKVIKSDTLRNIHKRWDKWLLEDDSMAKKSWWNLKDPLKRFIVYLKDDNRNIQEGRNLVDICIVPLPQFNCYSDFPEDREPGDESDVKVIPDKKDSKFIELATCQYDGDIFHQGDTILEVMLQYKWEVFVCTRFCLVYLLYLAYYASFTAAALFPQEAFGYEPGTSPTNGGHIACISLMSISDAILLFQEAHQFVKSHNKRSYISSMYNFIDFLAFILPVVNLIQVLKGMSGFEELGSICAIILWLHAILRLRVISLFGVTLETVIQMITAVYRTLFLMLLGIFAFTEAFVVLLRRRENAFFQEQYEGSLDLTNSNQADQNAMEFRDTSASNNFGNPFKAFSMLWFFIYGVWDPVNDGDAGDSYMVMILSIMYSLFTVLFFFNLVIALMSSKAEEVRARGKRVWISHFAAMVAEIEQIWCGRDKCLYRRNNPMHIYYIAKKSDIKKHEETLREGTRLLIKQLTDERSERIQTVAASDDIRAVTKEDILELISKSNSKEESIRLLREATDALQTQHM